MAAKEVAMHIPICQKIADGILEQCCHHQRDMSGSPVVINALLTLAKEHGAIHVLGVYLLLPETTTSLHAVFRKMCDWGDDRIKLFLEDENPEMTPEEFRSLAREIAFVHQEENTEFELLAFLREVHKEE